MRYLVTKTCFDFNGRLFKKGEEVELLEGRHSKYLVPLCTCEATAEEVAEAAEAAGDTAADAAADTEQCEAATTEVVAKSATKKTRKKSAGD